MEFSRIQGSSLPDISVEPQRSSGGDLLQTSTSLDLEEEFTEVVEGSVAKLDFLLVFVFALVGADTSELLQNHVVDCCEPKVFGGVCAELQSAEDLATAAAP